MNSAVLPSRFKFLKVKSRTRGVYVALMNVKNDLCVLDVDCVMMHIN